MALHHHTETEHRENEFLHSELSSELVDASHVESLSEIQLPNSTSSGLRVRLEEDFGLGGREALVAVLGDDYREVQKKQLSKYGFILIENIALVAPPEAYQTHRGAYSQILHHDSQVTPHFVLSMYHPGLGKEEASPRSAPTNLSDAKVYYSIMQKFFSEMLASGMNDLHLGQLDIEMIADIKSLQTFIEDGRIFDYEKTEMDTPFPVSFQAHLKIISELLQLPEHDSRVQYPAMVMTHFYLDGLAIQKDNADFVLKSKFFEFYEKNILSHIWKANDLLLINNFSTVHGRGKSLHAQVESKQSKPEAELIRSTLKALYKINK